MKNQSIGTDFTQDASSANYLNLIPNFPGFIRSLIETANDGVWAIDKSAKTTFVNRKMADMLGTTIENLYGKKGDDFLFTEDLEKHRQELAIRATGQPGCYEQRFRRLDGTELWTNVSVSPIIDNNGEYFGSFAMLKDITENKKAEMLLLEKEAELNIILQTVPDVITVVRLSDNTCLMANDGFTTTTGWEKGEVIGKTHKDLNIWVDPKEREKVIMAISTLGVAENIQARFRRKDGTEFIGLFSAKRLQFQGTPCLVSITRDITEKTKSEEKARYIEAHFRALFEKATDGVVLVGLNGEFKYASPGTLKMFKYEPEDIQYLDPNDLTHPQDLPIVLELIMQIIEDPSLSLKHEYRFRNKDGSWRWIESTFWNLLDEPGVEAIVINFRDISERKQAEAQIAKLNAELEQRVIQRTNELQEVNKELETFSYSVSHDLQAPLRRISGFVSLLLDSKTSNLTPEEEQFLGFISTSAKEMNDLISAMLSFSRLNRYDLRKTTIDTESMVKQVIQSFELETQNRKIEFKVDRLPNVTGDDELLKQVWANLLSNAIKYTAKKEQAKIEIGSVTGTNEVTFFVKDNGAGFDMKYVPKLFGVFQRLHKASEFEGVGIGLANVHRIIMRHGGRCKAEGEVDHGATIYFTLPTI